MKKLENLTRKNLKKILFSAIFACLSFSYSFAQSTNQSTPTIVSTNEINGTIRARDIGDSRLTNYFYTFNGNQGDVFVNVVTKNLDGDIDIFTIDGLKPLTKITVFSDNSDSETGRIVYLRKFEKLLLRVQGRSPNDDPATFRIKFAGSFQPLEKVAGTEETNLPEIDTKNQGEVRVNSVGAIIETVRKPTPKPETIAKTDDSKKDENVVETKEITVKSVEKPKVSETSAKIEIKRTEKTEQTSNNQNAEKTEQTSNNQNAEKIENDDKNPRNAKPVVVLSENIAEEKIEKVEPKTETKETVSTPTEKVAEANEKVAESVGSTPKTSNTLEPLKTEQLEKIELVVKFKDGKVLKRPLSKVFSFNVNQGILTIVLYDGSISRYSFLDIEKISMEEEEN